MKKRVEKSKSKPVATKSAADKTEPARRALPKAASPHDPLHSLLRGTHASKICR
jgi:hypothetical protein